MDVRSELSKITRDIVSGPDLGETLEIGVVGALVGAAVGYARGRGRGVKEGAIWGAGLGIGAQFLLFHMLKNYARHGHAHLVGQGSGTAQWHDICPDGSGWDSTLQKCTPRTCIPGTYWDDYYKKCVPTAGAPLPGSLPATLDEWRAQQHRVGVQSGPAIVGAVAGLGGARSGMPFGPGPWPTQGAVDPMQAGWGW